MIARGKVKVLRSSKRTHDPLAAEVGADLATLLREAETLNGVVLRPAPVFRPGVDMAEADLTGLTVRMADMHALLGVLADSGIIDHATQEKAKRYFNVQDRGWTDAARPEPNRPLLIDNLALTYLQHTGLFEPLVGVFKDVLVERAAEEEALMLIEYEQQVAEVLKIIDDIRKSIRDAHEAGKVRFGPRPSSADSNSRGADSSTFHLLLDFVGADAVCFDDRFLNKEPFAEDQKKCRLPCITSLDLIDTLHARGIVAESDRHIYRHRLRIGGAVLLPAGTDEIIFAALHTGAVESAEGRAIRESIDLAMVAQIPQFPKEIPWLISINAAIRKALFEVWALESDKRRAAALAGWIFYLIPKAEDWVPRWDGTPPPQWVEAVSRGVLAHLSMPLTLEKADLDRFNEFLEESVLEPLRTSMPQRFDGVVQLVKELILKFAGEATGERET